MPQRNSYTFKEGLTLMAVSLFGRIVNAENRFPLFGTTLGSGRH
jgi:hypothetical protein